MASTDCTKLDIHSNSINFTWEISNFSLIDKNVKEYLVSPDFKLGCENSEWFLGLCKRSDSDEDSGYVSLYIFCKNKNPNIELELSFAILDSNGEEANNYKQTLRIVHNFGHGVDKFISISDTEKYLINDKLTIVSKITAGANIIQISILSELKRKLSDELSQDFQNLFENQKFTDVKIVVKGKTFNAHKGILSSRSQFFLDFFESEATGNMITRVDIEGAEPIVVEEMLRFIYTGKVKDINLIARELFIISDQYNLEGLKLICEETLCKNFSVENVLDMIVFADGYNAKTLKTKAVEFSVTHIKEIIHTEAFKSLSIHSLSELCQAIAIK